MNSEKLIELAKQFSRLQADQRELDYRRATWAREAVACFTSEEKFVVWCKSDLAITEAAARDLCLLARAAKVVPDAKTWNILGGSRQIRAVEVLSKRDQVDVLEVAKATGRAIRTLVAERCPKEMPAPTPSDTTSAQMKDVERLAKFIAAHIDAFPQLPGDVEVIVRMYSPISRVNATAQSRAVELRQRLRSA